MDDFDFTNFLCHNPSSFGKVFDEMPESCLSKRHFLEIRALCPLPYWLGFAMMRVDGIMKILGPIQETEL